MSRAPAPGSAPVCLTLWDEEDFQGRRCRLLSDCANVCERGALRRVRSVKVENGAWVAFEYPDFQGQQFILEKGDYPCWSAWSGSSGHHSNQLLSFRPVLCAVSTANTSPPPPHTHTHARARTHTHTPTSDLLPPSSRSQPK